MKDPYGEIERKRASYRSAYEPYITDFYDARDDNKNANRFGLPPQDADPWSAPRINLEKLSAWARAISDMMRDVSLEERAYDLRSSGQEPPDPRHFGY